MRRRWFVLLLPLLPAGAQAPRSMAPQSLGKRIAVESTEIHAQRFRMRQSEPTRPELTRQLVMIEGRDMLVLLMIARELCDDNTVVRRMTLGMLPSDTRARVLVRF